MLIFVMCDAVNVNYCVLVIDLKYLFVVCMKEGLLKWNPMLSNLFERFQLQQLLHVFEIIMIFRVFLIVDISIQWLLSAA